MSSSYKTGVNALKHALSKVLYANKLDSLFAIVELTKNKYNGSLYDAKIKNLYEQNEAGLISLDAKIKGTIYQCFKLKTPRDYAVIEFDRNERIAIDEELTANVIVQEKQGEYGRFTVMTLNSVYTDYEEL